MSRHTSLKSIPKLAVVAALAGTAMGVQAQSTGAAAPTDPQIAAIVVAANQVDIDAGKLALKKSSNKDVKAFAQTMVRDHTGVNQAASELVHKLNVTPEPNATSESLTKGGDDNLAKLKGMSGKAFDKAYVDHEVAYHQAVLDAMDKTLIPDASNAELKALLVKVRPAFVTHLDHAKHLDAKLNDSGGY